MEGESNTNWCGIIKLTATSYILSMTTHLYVPAFTHTDEIPQGLQLIANAAGHTLLLNGQKPVQKRVLVASIFRLIVGYLFLSSLFINIAQNDDVIEIFYDGERVKQKCYDFLSFCLLH